MNVMSKRAILPVSCELLIAALKLPKETRIVNVRHQFDRDEVELLIEHPDFPEGQPCENYRRVSALIQRDMIPVESFAGWQIDL